MTIITALIVFILGTAVGSFLSVVTYRTKKNKGIVLDRSICPSCRKQIKWRHLIPIFSWMFLRGKCAYCGKNISFHYFALEVLTGLLFLAAFFSNNFLEIIPSITNPEFLSYQIDWRIFEMFAFLIIEFSLLLAIFFYDLLYKEIPDRFSIPAIVIALVGGLTFGAPSWESMLIGGAGVFLFFFLQLVLSRGAWIGGGDLRMGILMGFLLGWEKGILAVVLAYFTGAIFSIYLLIRGKVTRKSAIPFGPFLAGSTILVLFYGEEILGWYLDKLIF